MRFVVLGATGGTGLELVRQAIEQGHQVTALVRSSYRLKTFGDKVEVVEGNVLSSADLKTVIGGHDAVLSAFGPRPPISQADATLMRRFAGALTLAMRQTTIRRLVIESVAFLFKNAVVPPAYLFGRLFFPQVVEDSAAMEDVIETSRLDWTIVRPPRLTDKPRTAKYRVQEGHLPSFGFTISRADVADFMIKAAQDVASIGKIIGVSN